MLMFKLLLKRFNRNWAENGRLLLLTTFTVKCELVFVLTQENA